MPTVAPKSRGVINDPIDIIVSPRFRYSPEAHDLLQPYSGDRRVTRLKSFGELGKAIHDAPPMLGVAPILDLVLEIRDQAVDSLPNQGIVPFQGVDLGPELLQNLAEFFFSHEAQLLDVALHEPSHISTYAQAIPNDRGSQASPV